MPRMNNYNVKQSDVTAHFRSRQTSRTKKRPDLLHGTNEIYIWKNTKVRETRMGSSSLLLDA